jgi:proprotein convertase subtilisin/kexin type 5
MGYQPNPNDYTCMMNNCSTLSNCQLCDQYAYECHLCNPGYMVDNLLQGGKCLPVNQNYSCNIMGCAVCNSTNNAICSSCLPTYNFMNGTCVAYTCSIANCYLCLMNNICTVCDTGYYLAIGGTCQPKFNNIVNCGNSILFCDICVIGLYNISSTTNYCIKCQNGFNFMNGVCMPALNSIANCKVQTPDYMDNMLPICLICEQGYYINSYGQCSIYNPNTSSTGCTVYNCLYCALNSSTCSFCFVPWGISSTGICLTSNQIICGANCLSCLNSTSCVNCAPKYLPNNGMCVLCNILGCQTCVNANNCTTCLPGYINN